MLINPAPFVNDFTRALKTPVVRWVIPGWLSQSVGGNFVVVAARIYYIPIFVPERTLYDRIGINVQVGDGAAGQADLRIYRWDGGLPTTMVLNAGLVPTNGAGAQEIIIAETLERGYYFLAIRDDQAPTLRGLSAGAVCTAPVSGHETANAGNPVRFCVPLANGAMADPALAPTDAGGTDSVIVLLREA